MKNFLILAIIFCAVLVHAQDKNMLSTETKRDSILASVNGESITLQDVMLESNAEEAKLSSMFTGEDLIRKIEEVRRKVLEDLINRKLIYASYKKQPFDIPTQNVEDMVDALARIMGDGTRESLERRLNEFGSNMDELKRKVREKIATDFLIYKNCILHVEVTPKEIYDEYKANPARWKKQEQVEIQLLQVLKGKNADGLDPVKVVQNLKEMLKNADEEMFGEIVKKNSNGPNAAKGGKMGWIDRDKLRPEFAAPLKNAKQGDIIGPVETPEGYYFIRVGKLAGEEQISYEKAAPEIEKELREKAIQYRKRIYLQELKDGAVIRLLI
ncbi:MAG: hypothetical protein E7040_06530 [Lentisphaerae bacterium]|nr:hypothetical protein [Lentisphaerota bacterium]